MNGAPPISDVIAISCQPSVARRGSAGNRRRSGSSSMAEAESAWVMSKVDGPFSAERRRGSCGVVCNWVPEEEPTTPPSTAEVSSSDFE